jgi:hypothetical protein
MWKMLIDLLNRVAHVTQDTQKNKTDIAKLQEDVQWLMEKLRQANFESQRDRENAAHERENLLLRLEVTLLRAGQKGLVVTETPRPLLENTDEQG